MFRSIWPGKLSMYLIKEFFKILLLIIFSLFILIFIIDFMEFSPKIQKYSIEPFDAIKIVLFRIPSMLESFLQFIILLTTIFTLTKISSRSELTVIYANGFSTWKIIKIYSVICFSIGLLMMFLLNYFFANLSKLSTTIERMYTEKEINYYIESNNGFWFKQKNIKLNNENFIDDGEIIIRANRVYIDELLFRDVIVLMYDNDGNFEKMLKAKEMKLGDGLWILENITQMEQNKQLKHKDKYLIPTYTKKTTLRQQIQNRYEDISDMSFFTILKLIKEFKESGMDTYKFVARKHHLLIVPFLYVMMVFVGVLFSNNNNRSAKYIFEISKTIIVGIVVFILQNILFELGNANKINLLLSTWGIIFIFNLFLYVLLIKKIELQNSKRQ